MKDNFEIKEFTKGVHNRVDNEDVPKDASTESSNWLTVDGHIELARGNQIFGTESTIAGKTNKFTVVYNTNGVPVYFRQTGTKIQYSTGTTWIDTNITTLTATDAFTFTPYQNLYQNALFIAGPNGLYKFNVSNPANGLSFPKPVQATDKYVWGYMRILDGRGFRWNITQPSTDLTALYLSWTDKAFVTATALTNQLLGTGNGVQTVFTGTLPGLTGFQQAQAIIFNTNPASTGGYVDLNGVVQWTGVTGTVNLTTGAYSLTFAVAPAGAVLIRAGYSTVDDTNGGVLQNIKAGSYTSTVAFENKVLRQDEGGDAIRDVVFGIDGNVFSLKGSTTYRYVPDTADTNPKNEIYRKDLGVQSLDSAVSTSLGIYVINTTNTNYPELILLEKNPLGDNILSTPKLEHFDFSKYIFTSVQMVAWDRFIVAACKSSSTVAFNDKLIMMDLRRNTVDVCTVRTNYLFKDKATLYSCLPDSDNIQTLFTGFVDGSDTITNFWVSKSEDYGYAGLKKMKRFFIRGKISTTQNVEIYVITDNQGEKLIGTIRGVNDYVDASNAGSVGFSGVGEDAVGGGGTNSTIFFFLTQLKTKIPKYRIRAIKFKCIGIGYVSIDEIADNRIEKSETRIPKKYRSKSNVNLAGTLTNQYPFVG